MTFKKFFWDRTEPLWQSFLVISAGVISAALIGFSVNLYSNTGNLAVAWIPVLGIALTLVLVKVADIIYTNGYIKHLDRNR